MGSECGNHANSRVYHGRQFLDGITRHQRTQRDALADFILAINIKEPSKQSDKRGFLDEG